MIDNYQGDPLLILGINGATLKFVGGQPVMDRGLENLVLISLFTKPGWPGNVLFDLDSEKIGSDFEEITRQSITLQSINDMNDAALKALDNPAFGDVTVEITNPLSHRLNILINVKPPGQDILTLLVTKNGLNWVSQKIDPAHGRI